MKWLSTTNIFNFLCVYMPLLYIYKSPVPGVDWGTALVLLCSVFFFNGNKKHTDGMSSVFIAVLAYSIICTVINIVIGTTNYSSLTSIITRTGRFIFVMVCMMGFGYSNHFVPKKYIKLLRGLTLFVAGYTMLQALVFQLTGLKLINVIGDVNGDLALTASLGEKETAYRPPSIFAEPSHASYFMVPYLCYVLFFSPSQDIKVNKIRFREAIFVTLGILFTTSGQGLTVLAVCWSIWFLFSIKEFNFKKLTVFACILVFLLYNFDFNFTINRVITNEGMSAVDARQVGYLLYANLSDTYKFFGTGFGNYDDHVYYSSFAEILFCTGYIGLFLVMLIFLQPLFKGLFFQKVLAISCIILMSGGGIYTASYLCLYLPLLLYKRWDKVSIEKQYN